MDLGLGVGDAWLKVDVDLRLDGLSFFYFLLDQSFLFGLFDQSFLFNDLSFLFWNDNSFYFFLFNWLFHFHYFFYFHLLLFENILLNFFHFFDLLDLLCLGNAFYLCLNLILQILRNCKS